jgi:hypothetical protein
MKQLDIKTAKLVEAGCTVIRKEKVSVSGCEWDDLPIIHGGSIHGGSAKKKPRRFLRLQGSFSAIWVSVLRRLVNLFRRPLSAGNSDAHSPRFVTAEVIWPLKIQNSIPCVASQQPA